MILKFNFFFFFFFVFVFFLYIYIYIDNNERIFSKKLSGPKKGRLNLLTQVTVYLLLVYLVTALVPSLTACLASSPGRRRRTAVWISLLVMVDRLL